MQTSPFLPQASHSPPWPGDICRTIALGEGGLVIGVGTILARMTTGDGLALDTDRERLLALLSVAARRPMSADILGPVEAAAGHWRRGDKALANLRLVFAGLPQLADPTDAWRLRLAEILLDDGMSPRTLMVELDLDPAVLTRAHYNPDEPRVPARNGPESGRWGDGTVRDLTRPAEGRTDIIPVADKTTPNGAIYDDKIQRQMGSRGYSPEQVDEAVKFGPRIDAINKTNGGAAVRYVNPSTGQSVVIESASNRIIQVGRPDFKFGPGGGDVPGATLRPPPPALTTTPAPILEEPVIIPDIILPP